ncbi:MAG TPA: hypothetical protein ENJ53_04600, partial [Phaeodactylibacter sp.]|nr:hypothetical protein [Phaeodactylibacter sp.]
SIDTTTCVASEVGLDTIFMNTTFGCDSNIIYNYQLVAADTFVVNETTCDTSILGTTITMLPGMNGECDSILVTNITFGCDTIYTNSWSCNPLDTGVFVIINGNETTIDSVALAPTDTTYLSNTSCSPLDTGLVLTIVLQNIYGCDSLIFTQTTLLPSQNILLENTTCDPNLAGVFADTLQNQFGCDSIITQQITLLPSSIDTILTTTCFFGEIGIDTLFEGTNSVGCDSLVVAIMEYEQVMELFLSVSDISCFGEMSGAIVVDSVVGGSPPYMYSIDYGAFQHSPIFTNLDEGNYTIVVEDAEGCQTLVAVPVSSANEILVDLGDDIFIQIGDSATVHAQMNLLESEIDTIIWTPFELTGCEENCAEFIITPLETITFSIMVMDKNGCSDEDEITIHVDKNIPVFVPNAFSPNGDDFNDKLIVFGDEGLIEEVQSFRIFSRWGELVYEGKNFMPNDPAFGWDGTLDGEPMNPAVFVYYAEVKFIDGRVEEIKGDVALVK